MTPLESKPLYVVENIFNIFCVFLGRIGVIETKVAHAMVFLCCTEVHADGFCVTDMEVAVGLWREACLYASSVLAGCKVFFYELFYEVQTLLFCLVVLCDFHFLCFL